MEIKVLSKRCGPFDDDPWSPCGICGAVAEIVVDDNGKTVYLEAEWVAEAEESILFRATYESVYDYQNVDMDDLDKFLKIIDEGIEEVSNTSDAKESRYAEYYEEMTEMILQILSDEYGYKKKDITEMRKTFAIRD